METFNDLAKRAGFEPLTRDELDRVAAELSKTTPSVRPSTLLFILGVAGDRSYLPVVAPYLDHPDKALADDALVTIFSNWGVMDGPYRDRVFLRIQGVPGDVDQAERVGALAMAGRYLSDHHDPQMLREILSIIDNASERENLRKEAYLSILEAMGASPQEISSKFSARGGQDAIMDPVVMQAAKERLVKDEFQDNITIERQ